MRTLLLTLLLPAVATAQEVAPIQVPFDTLPSQHMTIQAKINGEGPFRFIFDTGAPDSIISTRVAAKAKVYDKDFKKPLFTLFGAQGQVKLRTLEIDGVKAENLSAMVVDHPLIELMRKEFGPLEGIVGFTFFARYKVSIDYEAKKMTFEPSEYKPKNIMEQLTKKLLMRPAGKVKPAVLAPEAWVGLKVEASELGVKVTQVSHESPAAKAGFAKDDLLLTLDGQWTDTIVDCHQILTRLKVGEAVSAEVRRGDTKKTLTLTPISGW